MAAVQSPGTWFNTGPLVRLAFGQRNLGQQPMSSYLMSEDSEWLSSQALSRVNTIWCGFSATANNPGSSAYSSVVKSEGVPIVGPNFGEHNLDPRVLINTAVSRTTLNVEWNSISATDVRSNVTGYKVRWYPSTPGAAGRTGSVNVSGKSTSSYAITGLTPGFYTVAVSAVNRIGSSEKILAVSDFGRTTIEVPPPS